VCTPFGQAQTALLHTEDRCVRVDGTVDRCGQGRVRGEGVSPAVAERKPHLRQLPAFRDATCSDCAVQHAGWALRATAPQHHAATSRGSELIGRLPGDSAPRQGTPAAPDGSRQGHVSCASMRPRLSTSSDQFVMTRGQHEEVLTIVTTPPQLMPFNKSIARQSCA